MLMCKKKSINKFSCAPTIQTMKKRSISAILIAIDPRLGFHFFFENVFKGNKYFLYKDPFYPHKMQK